jgi:hypothetical protein
MDTRLKYQLKPSTLDAARMRNDGRNEERAGAAEESTRRPGLPRII